MESWRERAGFPRRFGSDRCGWSSSTGTSTGPGGRRSARSPRRSGVPGDAPEVCAADRGRLGSPGWRDERGEGPGQGTRARGPRASPSQGRSFHPASEILARSNTCTARITSSAAMTPRARTVPLKLPRRWETIASASQASTKTPRENGISHSRSALTLAFSVGWTTGRYRSHGGWIGARQPDPETASGSSTPPRTPSTRGVSSSI